MSDERKAEDASIMSPAKEVFEGASAIDSTHIVQGRRFFIFDRAEYPSEGGILVHYRGMPYPRKGFPTPEAVWKNDIVKRMYRTVLSTLGSKDMLLPAIGFVLTPWFVKKRILQRGLFNLNRMADNLFMGHYLKPGRYCKMSRGLLVLVSNFLKELKFEEYSTELNYTAKIVATIFEYDDAYRYMFQDIATEASRDALIKHPIREVRRLLKIFSDRQFIPEPRKTIQSFGKILTFALVHPKFRKAFTNSIASLSSDEFRIFQLDNADRYHILNRNDYNFTGRTYEERSEIYRDVHRASKCCVDKVTVDVDDSDSGNYVCSKCNKVCEMGYLFPPEIEIAP